MTARFFIEQIAIYPADPDKAIKLLAELGLCEWSRDVVVARGRVMPDANAHGLPHNAPHNEPIATNVARLAFNYEATRGVGAVEPENGWDEKPKPLEVEVLQYDAGANWMEHHGPSVSHLGMHCTDITLAKFRGVFKRWGIGIAQEVNTVSHVNPAIAGKRWYTYVIFNTRPILGVDLKFIVRRDSPLAV